MKIPDIVFIIPYRNRKTHKDFFERHMKYILQDTNSEIYFSHQCDNKSFNRGAMKNIGFLAIKEKYPNDYKNITFVFNDVDCMPFTKEQFNYTTKKGTVKHFYGFRFALGGIVSINGSDFEKINGFPNYWSWGFEDNSLNDRVKINNIDIDRSVFYEILHEDIIHFQHGYKRNFNKSMPKQYVKNKYKTGLNSLSSIKYVFDNNFININSFSTGDNDSSVHEYDIRSGVKFNIRNAGSGMNMNFT